MKSSWRQILIKSFFPVFAAVMLVTGIAYAVWTEPTANPPGNNAEAPINVGSSAQYKSGALGIGGLLAAFGGFQMPTGAGAGKVLTSDASGIGTWQAGGGACPLGFNDTGYGYCIQANESPAISDWYKASDYCADTYNARLCSSSEWYSACVNNKASDMTGNWEWIDDITILKDGHWYVAVWGSSSCSTVSGTWIDEYPGEPGHFHCCRSK